MFPKILTYYYTSCYPSYSYPKSFPFALKSNFAFEIHCKKHLPTPKTTATQPSTVVIDGKSLSVECCLEPKNALWHQVTV